MNDDFLFVPILPKAETTLTYNFSGSVATGEYPKGIVRIHRWKRRTQGMFKGGTKILESCGFLTARSKSRHSPLCQYQLNGREVIFQEPICSYGRLDFDSLRFSYHFRKLSCKTSKKICYIVVQLVSPFDLETPLPLCSELLQEGGHSGAAAVAARPFEAMAPTTGLGSAAQRL